MSCNCNNNGGDGTNYAIIPHVFGNLLKLAIPLTLREIIVENGEIQHIDTDFIPSSDYPIVVTFSKGAVAISIDAIMRDGNVAYIEEYGTIPVGKYDITITCKDGNGNPYRFKQKAILQVFDSTAEAGIESPIEYEVQTWYLDAALYLALKGEDGVGILDISTQSSDEIGGTNYITFILTDGRTKTFTILNGSGVVDRELNIESPQPIANSVVTAKFNEIDSKIANFFGDADYDSVSKTIRFWDKEKTSVLASIDARPFIKDGMISNVYMNNNTLVITFNTDAGREAIAVSMSSIFNPNNYYNRTQVENRISNAISNSLRDYYTTQEINQKVTIVIPVTNRGNTYSSNADFGAIRNAISENNQNVVISVNGSIFYQLFSCSSEEITFSFIDLEERYQSFLVLSDTDEWYENSVVIEGGGSSTTQVQSDWNVTDTANPAFIKNKPTLFSGSYNDLTDKPTIPAAYDETALSNRVSALENAGYIITEKDPTVPQWAKQPNKPSYTASEVGAVPTTRTINGKALSSNVTLTPSDIGALPATTTIPTKTSDLTNDSGFIDESSFDISSLQDGTIVFVIGSDTYTIDLNHEHPQYVEAEDLADVATSGSYNDLTDKPSIPSLNGYLKFYLCQDEAEYNAIQNKDSSTLYLIPEEE